MKTGDSSVLIELQNNDKYLVKNLCKKYRFFSLTFDFCRKTGELKQGRGMFYLKWNYLSGDNS